MINVKIPYTPRYPQTEIHPQLETHRFNVLVTHRQMGKTVCAINHIIKMALQNPLKNARYFYVAPFLKQAKMLAWDYLKRFSRPFNQIPDPNNPGKFLNILKINEAELSVSVPGKFTVYICGADNEDALRGTYADGVVLDEYGDIKPHIYDEIIRPMLLSREGWTLFFGTPKGQNQFYDVYCRAVREMQKPDSEWWAGMYRADQTGVISPKELEQIKAQTPENTFRQEYLCDFAASAQNVLISIDDVLAGLGRYYSETDLNGAPKIIGVDPARFGDDRSVIFKRRGLQAYRPTVLNKLDNVDLAGRVAQEAREFEADAVFVDAGNGAGVIDVLRRMGHDVIEVPFGSAPLSAGEYANKRAEMWGEMAKWIKAGGALADCEGLARDLTCASYQFDAAGRMKLESKEKIKERFGKSPDLADALALTFAFPVSPRAAFAGTERENYIREYDFLS